MKYVLLIFKIITTYNFFIILWILSTSTPFADSYRVLGIFPLNTKSHTAVFNAIMKGLAKRGHQVDDITHNPLKNAPPSYKVEINLNGLIQGMANNFTIETTKIISKNPTRSIGDILGNQMCELLAIEEFQQFLKNLRNRPSYDVLITEAFGAHCFMGIGHLLKIPIVALSSAAEYPWISNFIGNYDNLALIPNILSPNFDRNNFWDRLNNVINHYWITHDFCATTEVQTEYMRKYISPDMPSIREVEKSVALTIVNRHPVIFGAKAISPSLIEVGGIHIEENYNEPGKALKKWLDGSKHGVVYFTLGSLVLIETLPVDTMKEIYECFAKLAPIRVLMKIVEKNKLPAGLPKNVKTLPWIPQQAILAHKNTRVFLMHGGLLGCQEALYYGVPIIAIPLYADQGRNIAGLVEKNMAVKLDLENITTVSLDEAFNKVLKDPQYRKNAKLYSKIFKDRPMSAMDTAVFWIEYIIRNGPETLRSPGHEMPWWQIALIDVYGFIFLSLIIVFALIYYILKKLWYSFLTGKNTSKRKKKVH